MDGISGLLHEIWRQGAAADRGRSRNDRSLWALSKRRSKACFLRIQNEREWERFCRVVLERGELVRDPRFDSGPRRVANRRDLHLAIEEVFSRLSASEIIARLDQAQIANVRMNSVQEFLEHPQ